MAAVWPLLLAALHLAAAGAAVVLAAWQLTRPAAPGGALRACAGALLVSALWAGVVLAQGPAGVLADILLSLSYLAWLWLLYRLFASDERVRGLGPIGAVVAALAFVEMLQIAVALAGIGQAGVIAAEALILRFAAIFRLLFCIGALVLVHNLYVGADNAARQSLRWPAAALALLWLYDLNLFTLAYLLDGMPALLADLRGLAQVLAVALLALGTLRQETELRFSPSRSFAFQSFSLLAIGAYLVAMVVAAQGIAYAGSDYGAVLQFAFLAVASLLALVLVSSRKLRGWLRVTLAKNLFQHRYDYRAEWLRFTDTIGRAGANAAPLPERVVQAVADIADAPRGLLLTPREEGGMALAARWNWRGIEVPGEALSAEGIAFYETSHFILDIDEIRAGQHAGIPVAACPQWLREEPGAWAMVPLLHYERLVGLVVLARGAVQRRLDWEDFDLLRVVGRQLASYLAEQASQSALGEAQRFDEFNRRIAFVMHDIKNLASQLSLLARNAEKHADKPAFRADMVLTLKNSTDKLQALLARLSRYGAHGAAQRGAVDLAALLVRVAGQYAGKHDVVAPAAEQPCLAEGDAEALEQALVHLVQNAIEASDAATPVVLDLRREAGGRTVIEVIDSGSGMSADFIRTRLFKPFHSSKPGGFGIGAFEARELVRAMGGQLDVESREGLGTRFAIRLPTAESAQLIRNLNEVTAKVA